MEVTLQFIFIIINYITHKSGYMCEEEEEEEKEEEEEEEKEEETI